MTLKSLPLNQLDDQLGANNPHTSSPSNDKTSSTKISDLANKSLNIAKTALSNIFVFFTPGTVIMQSAALIKPQLLSSSAFTQTLSICSFVAGGLLCVAGTTNIVEGIRNLAKGEKKGKCLMQVLIGLCQIALGTVLILAAAGKISLIAHPWIIPLTFMIPALLMILKTGKQWILSAQGKTIYQKLGLGKEGEERVMQLIKKLKLELDKKRSPSTELVKKLRKSFQPFLDVMCEKTSDNGYFIDYIVKKETTEELAEEIGAEGSILTCNLFNQINKLLTGLAALRLGKIDENMVNLATQAGQISSQLEKITSYRKKSYLILVFKTLVNLLYIAGFALSIPPLFHLLNFNSTLAQGIGLCLFGSAELMPKDFTEEIPDGVLPKLTVEEVNYDEEQMQAVMDKIT
jgi:hypothetical protein